MQKVGVAVAKLDIIVCHCDAKGVCKKLGIFYHCDAKGVCKKLGLL